MLHFLIRRATATPTRQLLSTLALSSAAGLAMLAFRFAYTGRVGYWSLPWDLFLAWVPVPLAVAVERLQNRPRVPWLAVLALGFVWLLFFPNAPYLVTEFIHLHPSHAVHDGPLPRVLLQYSPQGD